MHAHSGPASLRSPQAQIGVRRGFYPHSWSLRREAGDLRHAKNIAIEVGCAIEVTDFEDDLEHAQGWTPSRLSAFHRVLSLSHASEVHYSVACYPRGAIPPNAVADQGAREASAGAS